MNATCDMVVLYVSDVAASARFYARLFGCEPVEQLPGFAMFVLDGGMKLGLWLKSAVDLETGTMGGGGELVVLLDSCDAVDALLTDWRAKGVDIARDVAEQEFGYSFVVLDPDKHRIRPLLPT